MGVRRALKALDDARRPRSGVAGPANVAECDVFICSLLLTSLLEGASVCFNSAQWTLTEIAHSMSQW